MSTRSGTFLNGQLDHTYGIVQRIDGAPQIQAPDNHQAALQALADQRAAQGQQGRDAQRLAALGGVEGSQLHGEFMLAGVAIPDEFDSSRVKILLGVFETFRERPWRRPVENAHAAARSLGDFNPVQACPFVLPAGANGPDLAGRQRIAADLVFALQLRCDHKGFDTVWSEGVAELGVAKLRDADALLLLLDPTPALQA
jgi:hypothetical protein